MRGRTLAGYFQKNRGDILQKTITKNCTTSCKFWIIHIVNEAGIRQTTKGWCWYEGVLLSIQGYIYPPQEPRSFDLEKWLRILAGTLHNTLMNNIHLVVQHDNGIRKGWLYEFSKYWHWQCVNKRKKRLLYGYFSPEQWNRQGPDDCRIFLQMQNILWRPFCLYFSRATHTQALSSHWAETLFPRIHKHPVIASEVVISADKSLWDVLGTVQVVCVTSLPLSHLVT